MSVRESLRRLENDLAREIRDGVGRFSEMTDEELREFRDSGPPIPWDELTDREVERIAAGGPLPSRLRT